MALQGEVLKAFAEALAANEGASAKMKAALEARDPKAVAALANELGFELTEDDFPMPTSEELEGASVDEKELEAVAGGLGGTFKWVEDCSWYAGLGCGLAAGGFFWMGDENYTLL